VPVGMPQDTAFDAYFLSRTADVDRCLDCCYRPSKCGPESFEQYVESSKAALSSFLIPFFSLEVAADAAVPMDSPRDAAEEILLALAWRLDSDGGMPGNNRESRVNATLIALLAFLSQGHTPTSGAFRSHVARPAVTDYCGRHRTGAKRDA